MRLHSRRCRVSELAGIMHRFATDEFAGRCQQRGSFEWRGWCEPQDGPGERRVWDRRRFERDVRGAVGSWKHRVAGSLNVDFSLRAAEEPHFVPESGQRRVGQQCATVFVRIYLRVLLSLRNRHVQTYPWNGCDHTCKKIRTVVCTILARSAFGDARLASPSSPLRNAGSRTRLPCGTSTT